MSLSLLPPEFKIERDDDRCIACQVCVRQCANDVHAYDQDDDWVYSDYSQCVGCHRCVTLCPTRAITCVQNPLDFRANANWTHAIITGLHKQAETGGILLSGMGCDQPQRIYFDHLLLNASQVTNPSIDPLREPMELRTYIGRKPDRVEVSCADGEVKLETELAPQLALETPIMFSAMSYGSISYHASLALAQAAKASVKPASSHALYSGVSGRWFMSPSTMTEYPAAASFFMTVTIPAISAIRMCVVFFQEGRRCVE